MGAAAETSWGSVASLGQQGGTSRHPPEEDGDILGTLANGAGCGPGAACGVPLFRGMPWGLHEEEHREVGKDNRVGEQGRG